MKLEELLRKGKRKLTENQIEDASFIARVLLQYVLKLDRTDLILREGQEIEEGKEKEYWKTIEKIVQGIPIQYITKSQEFYGLNFYVDENVLIPQPDTEILVEEVLKIAQQKNKILDICTGSGCIGIALARCLENVEITMSDISRKALEIAKKNAIQNGVIEKVKLLESNLFEKINEKYDIIVSNPPYIETNVIKTLSKQVQNEPKLALDGGKDGLYFYRRLLEEASKYLEKKGYLCIEIGYQQKEQVIELAKKTGVFSKIEVKQDLTGNDRVIIAKR